MVGVHEDYIKSRLRLAVTMIRHAERALLADVGSGDRKTRAEDAEFALMTALGILLGSEEEANQCGLDGLFVGWIKGLGGDSK